MNNIKYYLILNLILFFYSLGGICSKAAAGKSFLSFDFILFYCMTLFILAVYAVLWQQIIKKIPLNIAYANKAITLVWGIVIFKEYMSLSNIIGVIVVLVGVLLVVTGGEKER